MFNGDTYVSNSLYLGGTEITSTATELNLLTGATSLGTGILSPVTENSNTGVRLSTALAANHGDIGSNAVDLSYSHSASTTRGATGNISTAMGFKTIASGPVSTAMGGFTTASGTYSTAMGRTTTASGYASTAMGDGTTASGNILQQWEIAQQQVESVLQQWDCTQQQVEIILQQWEKHRSKWRLFYSNGKRHRQQVEIILQQWEMTQKQVEIILQQWEIHNSKWNLFYSNGRVTTASGNSSTAMGESTKQVEVFYSNGSKHNSK